MEFDDLLVQYLGELGTFQLLLYFLLGLTSVFAAFYNMGIVFIMANPDYWCSVPSADHLNLTDDVYRNLTHPTEVKDGLETYKTCEIYNRNYSSWTVDDVHTFLSTGHSENVSTVMCTDGYIYDDSIYKSTIVTDFDLTCEEGAWLQATASSVYMAGLMVGVIVFGNISDRFGRKPSFAVTMILMIAFAISVAFAPNYVGFVCLRFFLATAGISFYTVAFVVVMEMIGPKWRMHFGIGFQYFWVIGYVIVGVIAYFIREWRKIQLIIACPAVLFIGFLFIVPESARWLYSSNQPEKARVVVEKIAKWNKVQLPKELHISQVHTGKAYMWDLFKTPRMRCRTFNIYYNWFVNSVVYYGLSLNTSNLGGNDFVNFFIGAGVEVPAYILCQITLQFLGRRIPLAASMIIAGVALVLTLAVPSNLNWISISLAMLGKLMISASFAIIYVFTAELYPTPVRNVAVASGSLFARIGGIAAPYIGQLSIYSKVIPLIIFGALSVLAGFLALLFPETKDKNLPETLEEGENFGLKKKESETKDKTGFDNPAMEPDPEDPKTKIPTKEPIMEQNGHIIPYEQENDILKTAL